MSARNGSWDQRAADFHEQNPHVYKNLRALALKTRRAGHTRLGIGQLWEVLRWEYLLRTTEHRPILNNNYRAFYARLLMASEPELAGVFVIRGGGAVGIADGLAATLPDVDREAA